MKKNFRNTPNVVVDIGARFGLHSTWKNYKSDTFFYLIEPDLNEIKRLKKKYKDKIKKIEYINTAISDIKGKVNFFNLSNPAMSGIYERKNISPLFKGDRKSQLKSKVSKVYSQSLNDLRKSIKKRVDFYKIDVEGSEYSILKNYNYFDEVIGIRSEISFDSAYKKNLAKEGSFGAIHSLLRKHNFILLNLDYEGRGDYFSEFIDSKQKYGVCQQTDAVWIKDPNIILKTKDPIILIKLINFLFKNNAPDLSLHLLKKSSKILKKISNTSHYDYAKFLTIHHFHSIKWTPNQKIAKHAKFYEDIFDSKYPQGHAYNSSILFNPD